MDTPFYPEPTTINGNPVNRAAIVRLFALLAACTTDLARAGWYIRSIANHPRGPKVMWDAPWPDGRHVATVSIEFTGVLPVLLPEVCRFRVVNETCSLGPTTTALYKKFHDVIDPLLETA